MRSVERDAESGIGREWVGSDGRKYDGRLFRAAVASVH